MIATYIGDGAFLILINPQGILPWRVRVLAKGPTAESALIDAEKTLRDELSAGGAMTLRRKA